MKILVAIAFVLILASLGSALVFLMKDKGKSNRTVKALAFRVGFSIALFILILIAVIEASQGPSLWLWLASVAFLLARVAHPFGMDGVRWCRAGGILVTFLLLLGLGLYAVLTPLGMTRHSPPTIETMPPQG